MSRPDRILLVKYRFLGDAILALPAFEALREAYPNAEIDILTEPIIAQLLRSNPWNINPIVIQQSRLARTPKGLISLMRRLRKNRYTMSCNFIHEFTFADSLLVFLSGIPVRAGFNVNKRGFLFTHRVPIEGHQYISQHGHMTDINAMIPEALGVQVKNRFPRLWTDPESDRQIEPLLAAHQISRPIVGINPSTRNPIRTWPKEYFIEVIRYLAHNYNVDIIVTGTPEESVNCNEVVQKVDHLHVHSFAGKTSLHQLISLVKKMKLCISGTTGVMHVAASLGTPIIAIRGGDEPMWDPLGEGTILQLRDSSAPPYYSLKDPGAQAYMQTFRNIKPERVIEMIDSVKAHLQ